MSDSPLSELRGKRRITVRLDAGLAPALGRHAEVVIGRDPHGTELQVLIAEWSDAGEPPIQALRELHKWRLGKKAFPLVTVIRRPEEVRPGGASIAPTSGERGAVEPRTVNEPGGVMNLAGTAQSPLQPSLLTDRADREPTVVERWLGGRKGATGEQRGALVMGPDADVRPVWLPEDQLTQMLRATLDEPSAPSAQERIVSLLKQVETARTADRPQAGIDNSGLFSRHYLTKSLPGEQSWALAQDRSRPLLARRGTDLIRGLGFRTGEPLDQAIVLMGEGGDHRAVAVLLERTETFDAANRRLGMSPAAYGLDKATKRGADWLILLRGAQIRLYATRPGTGVGSRSPVETCSSSTSPPSPLRTPATWTSSSPPPRSAPRVLSSTCSPGRGNSPPTLAAACGSACTSGSSPASPSAWQKRSTDAGSMVPRRTSPVPTG